MPAAENPGLIHLKDGKNGEDIIIKVPVGTIVKDAETEKLLLDLSDVTNNMFLQKVELVVKGIVILRLQQGVLLDLPQMENQEFLRI